MNALMEFPGFLCSAIFQTINTGGAQRLRNTMDGPKLVAKTLHTPANVFLKMKLFSAILILTRNTNKIAIVEDADMEV